MRNVERTQIIPQWPLVDFANCCDIVIVYVCRFADVHVRMSETSVHLTLIAE